VAVVWVLVWVTKGMPEVQLLTGWNIAGLAFSAAVLTDLVIVLWSQRRTLAYIHLFGRTYIPDQGWVRDPDHTLEG
jgi:hypothetical protein